MFKRIRLWFSYYLSLTRVYRQTLYGIWRLTGIPGPKVTIFGSARLEQENSYAKLAHQIGSNLVQHDISVLTGGGPGIMEAAQCGAISNGKKARTLGIGVKELGEGRNPCAHEYIELDYFFARKWLLTHYSTAFIVFPGGFGTLDELGEILTLIQTKRLSKVPIVLIGKSYWNLLMQWLENEALRHSTISAVDLQLFIVTDSIDEALDIVVKFCKSCKNTKDKGSKA